MPVDVISDWLKTACGLREEDEIPPGAIDIVLEEVRTWQSRRLELNYASLHFATVQANIRKRPLVSKRNLHIAVATSSADNRDMLGIWVEHEHGREFWLSVLNDLKTRGVAAISTIEAGGLYGLPRAAQEVFPESAVKGPAHADDRLVDPLILQEDLTHVDWIGFSAAIEWIASRGQKRVAGEYVDRLDEAAATLIDHLASLDAAACESSVEGLLCEDDTPDEDKSLKPIPHGIWRLVSTGENDSGKPYQFVLVDGDDEHHGGSEWGGELSGKDRRWTQLRVRTAFILETWRPGTRETKPGRQHGPGSSQQYSPAELKRVLDFIMAEVPSDRAPLSQVEVAHLCKLRMEVPETAILEFFAKYRPTHWPAPKRGPSGPRQPDRQRWLKEFGEKIIVAELAN